MPSVSAVSLVSLASGLAQDVNSKVRPALAQQDVTNQQIVSSLNSALVVGDTLQILTPYDASTPQKTYVAGSSFSPFTVMWPSKSGPTLVIAILALQGQGMNPIPYSPQLPTWTFVANSQGNFVNITALPGLTNGSSYAITLVAF